MKKEFFIRSSDGVHTLSGVVYIPDGEVKGFFHVVHGMTEHIGRYDRFMTEICNNGYITLGYDNLGHGHTANGDSELGYIAKKGGWELLSRDVKVFSDAVRAEFSEYGDLPYYLMGHSMGSFIVRMATERYITPTKLIIMGTGGKNPLAGAGLAVIGAVKLFCGDRHISKLVDSLAFGSYNKKFEGDGESEGGLWLTNDKSVREKYYEDKYCTFKFTVSAMGDLIRLTKYSNRGAWFKKIPDVDILLVSGKDDPVGNYGKGVDEVCTRLKKAGKNAACILYENARHEILNDFTYEKTKEDILSFIEK